MRSGVGLRAVVDTNLFVSGTIIPRGKPFTLLEAWRVGLFQLILSTEQRDELGRALRGKRVAKYGIGEAEIERIMHRLNDAATTVVINRPSPIPVRDPKDELILVAGLDGDADYLVTGDDDLLVLAGDPRLGKLQIVGVGEFLGVLGTPSEQEQREPGQ